MTNVGFIATVFFGEFNSFMIILFLIVVYCSYWRCWM